jgi:DNA-binding winged helix-turn-helix (wHTH) protein/tetratricopeptide (TPR) repeat protein
LTRSATPGPRVTTVERERWLWEDRPVLVRFADIELDRDRMVLRRAGEEVAVEPQVFEVLAHLVEHRDRLVPKTELLDEIWGDRFVSESALSSRIKSARQAIGDNGRDQRLIRTVHGRGFRFVGDVLGDGAVVGEGAGAGSPGASPVAPAGTAGSGDPAAGVPRWTATDLPSAVVTQLRSGRGAAVEIVGPSAPARTELLEDVLAAAADAGLLVGRASGAVGTAGWSGGAVTALDEWVQHRPELLDQIPPGCAGELQAVFDGGEPSSRPRLAVSARELLVAAGRAGGAVLGVDQVHLIDAVNVDLLTHLARSVRHVPVVVVVSHRDGFRLDAPTHAVRLDAAPVAVEDAVPASIRPVLARAAVLGETIESAELGAATGLGADELDRVLADGLAAGTLIGDTTGHRFVDAAVVDHLAATVAPSEQVAILLGVADALEAADGPPARVADLFLRAGDIERAGPHLVLAALDAALRQLPGHVVQLTEVVDDVRDPQVRRALLELRADAGATLGLPESISWYRTAIREAGPEETAWLRARLARACLMASDLDGARDALDGVELTGTPIDGGILMIRGMVAYMDGDLDEADACADAARPYALLPGAPAAMLDVIALQGMIAHTRGEWFDRLRRELRVAADARELASTLFDSHICVAQYLLYGPVSHDEVVQLAEQLRAAADAEGLRPAAGFALTLIGEASLLSGDLDRAREALQASVELHASIGADTGHAHALQRLAEVELASGDRATAERLARRSLTLARWSPLSAHLLQRTYGTLISAAPDPVAAAAVVDEVATVLDGPNACGFCQVMVAVPATVALAQVGRLDEARRQLAEAARCAERWQGEAWGAAVDEAAAAVAEHEGDPDRARALLERAAAGFAAAGQPLDEARCREALV